MAAKNTTKMQKKKAAPPVVMKGGLKVMNIHLDDLLEAGGRGNQGRPAAKVVAHFLTLNRGWFAAQGLDKEGVEAFRLFYAPSYRSIFLKLYSEHLEGTKAFSLEKSPGGFRQSIKGLLSAANEPQENWQGDVQVEKVYVEGLEEVYLISKPKGRHS